MTEENKKLCSNMFGVANAYKSSVDLLKTCGVLLEQKRSRLPSDFPLNLGSVSLPSVLLYGISIEIFLKIIYLADTDSTIKGHDWEHLFQSLSQERQSEIEGMLNDEYKTDFHSLLNANKDTFVKWRYTYEATSLTCNIGFVQNLADVLTAIAMKLTK